MMTFCDIDSVNIYIFYFFPGTMQSGMMMPVMIGMLIKMAATIPLVLILAIFVGTISLLGSKLSLIISSILGIKQLISMISPTPKMTMPMITKDDLADLQQVMVKQSMMPSIPMSNPKINLPMPMPMDMMKQEMMMTDNAMQSNLNTQQWSDWYTNYNHFLKDNLYNPESYFAYTPSGAGYNTYESLKNNQASLDDANQVAGAHVVQDLERSNGQGFEQIDPRILAQKRAKVKAIVEMAHRANAVIQKQQLENPNRRMGVKIIKTVTKHVT